MRALPRGLQLQMLSTTNLRERVGGNDVTLSDIEKIPREYIIPREAAAVLGCTPYYINIAAEKCPEKLGFPVFKSGNRVKIPKEAFIRFMRGDTIDKSGI